MAQETEQVTFSIRLISESDDDPERMDRLTRSLRSEIQGIGLDSVALGVDKTKADGSKGGGAVLPGVMVLEGMLGVMPKVFEALQGWVMRGQNQAIKIEIQRGDNKVNLSYIAKSTTHEDIGNLVDKLNQELK